MQRVRLLLAIALGSAAVAAAYASDTARGVTRVGPTTGVVVIETNLAYQDGSAAGTGMVVGSNGIVLTNNHVIRGATTIRVRAGGRAYTASVVGDDIADDVAVLRLSRASGLATVRLGDSGSVRHGQSVTAVGNARGAGTLVSAAGTITAVGTSITVRDDQGGRQRLTGLIRTDADLQPGDSGGPLLDASGRVVGIDTAASVGFAFQRTGASEAFAIPINRVLAIAKQIRAGRSSAKVHVGPTAFLGVSLQPDDGSSGSGGALIADVVPGGAAESAGLGPGDTLIAIDGGRVTTTASILPILQRKKPGQTVALTWLDQFGQRHSGGARLASGPPQ